MGYEHRFNPHSQLQLLRFISCIGLHCADCADCSIPTLQKDPTQRQIRDEYDYHHFGNGCIFVLQHK